MSRLRLVLLAVGLAGSALVAQSQDIDALIASRVQGLDEGKADQVKAELPALVSKYQNHPGVLYLQGRLATNGVEAAKYYQMVMDNFPTSEWADDALYRIHLYYYSLGLARTAELKMQQLRKDYPNSPYIKGGVAAQQVPAQIEQVPPPAPTPQPQPVIVPPVTTEPPVMIEPPPVTEPAEAGYALQVGAFSSITNATRLKAFFEDLGYSVDVQNKVRGGRSLHLVWVGRFSTANEARRFGTEVKNKHKIESIVVTR